LNDYDELFVEKLDLLLKLRESERVTWSGVHRPALRDLGVYPRPAQQPLPVWIAVGGTPASVARAGTLGLPMALAIIGGMPERFAPLVELYREAGRRAGNSSDQLTLSINSHGFIADSSEQAAEDYFPSYAAAMNKIGRERGWPPVNRQQFDAARTLRGSDFVGSPEQIVEKILFQHQLFGHQRLLLQLGLGNIEHQKMLRAIELLGTQVAPVVRKEIERRIGAKDAPAS
jgi:alkanesulfonate monooxygenase SsuD/methylene tetrahydromethanopterin reductase-like flavin-dependent oxidoreductase (luciferase family)